MDVTLSYVVSVFPKISSSTYHYHSFRLLYSHATGRALQEAIMNEITNISLNKIQAEGHDKDVQKVR